MNFIEFSNILNLIKSDQIVRSVAVIISTSCLLLAILISPLAAGIIFLNYLMGFVVCWCLVRYQKNASFCLQRFVSFYRIQLATNKSVSPSCGICNDKYCSRHKLTKKSLPWKKIKISKKLNSSIEHFYNRLLDSFISSWYSTFSSDILFLNELKFSLRHATACAANKIQELDIGSLIANKFIPCAIKHLDDYVCMEQIGKLKNVDANKITVDYLGKRLHIAVTNRENEINYLRHLTSCLFPKLLPKEYLSCSNYTTLLREIVAGCVLLPMTDVLADPNVINLFVVLGTTYKSKGMNPCDDSSEKVEILHSFINKDIKYSPLASDLKTVLKDRSVLYSFMQFLKKEGSVHILQFCLEIEEFNNKLLMPDLSKRQLEDLHVLAYNIYKNYINNAGTDYIGCPETIAIELGQLLEGGMYNVAKLRTSEPLFQAYDYAFGILEKDFLLQFYHSNEFYNLLCGTKVTATYKKSWTSARKFNENQIYQHSTVAKISSGLEKIKGALQSKQPIEGYYTPDAVYPIERTHFIDDIMPHTTGYRDLSTWRVTIQANTHQHHRTAQIFNVYVERVESIPDNDQKSWRVQRKDNDFFLLKAKLIEFHGESEIADQLLLSKRNVYSADIEQRRLKYEDFIRNLLAKPSLRSSDLLYTFLKSEQSFADLVTYSVPSVDLENIYQSVTNKLRKEKGQHLDSFMSTFSLNIGKILKNTKIEWTEIGTEIDNLFDISTTIPKTYKSKTFGNNYNVPHRKIEDMSSTAFSSSGICESIFYLLKHTFKVRPSILKLYTAICNVSQQSFESLCRILIERKIKLALSQSNLAILIELLEGVLFDKHRPLTQEELIERKNTAFRQLANEFPQWLVKILGDDVKKGVADLLKMLQNPLYNKQLVYSLLDILVAEMYPELDVIQNLS